MKSEPPIDTDRIDDAVLALLYLGVCERRKDMGVARAWKTFDWEAMGRLYDKGLIDDPVGKAKSVWFTEEGLKRAETLFHAMFAKAAGA